MALGISVIICCYNSAERLPETLAHLARQVVPDDILWEIIVVDNASTDHTAEVAAELWRKYDSEERLKVIKQPIPGKNFAFELGIANSLYDYILTCDDDNWLNSNYIQLAYEIISSDDNIGALGGCGIFEPEQPVNNLILEYKTDYVNGSQTWTDTHPWVYGAGSVYKKSILTQLKTLGWQQITTGRLGDKLICGEDVEICFMMHLLGYKIIADDRLLFQHFVPQKRQTINHILNLKYWMAYTNVLLNSYFSIFYQDKRLLKKVLNNWLISITKTVAKQLFIKHYRSIITRKPASIEEQSVLQNNLGTFHALLHKRKAIVAHHLHVKQLLRLNQ